MTKKRPFNSEKVVEEKVYSHSPTLKAYHIGFDQKKFRLSPLTDVLMDVIPEFALGFHEGQNIPSTEIVSKLREAAKIVYQTEKYESRGEFGELILHFLLRDFHNTIPLVSKIYFKDSVSMTVHGFDSVQITTDNGNKKLWLGESKLYKDGKSGIRNLIEDLKQHLTADYLKTEMSLLSTKLPNSIEGIEYWKDLMHKNTKLDTIFKNIVIPMVCTFNCDIFKKHCDETADYHLDFEKECKVLHELFVNHKPKHDIDILLFLLPLPDKDELIKELDTRLKRMQSI